MPFIEGMLAGYGIAIPVGAIAILIIDIGLRHGFQKGFMAGAGAATADVLYAALAAVAGGFLVIILKPVAGIFQLASGIVLIGIGCLGIWRAWRSSDPSTQPNPNPRDAWGIYTRFLGLTLLNPMTVAYFTTLILGGAGTTLNTWMERLAFVLGAGIASLSWQSLIAGFGALGHRHLPTRFRFLLSLAGNLIVIGLGLRIFLSLFKAG